MYNQSKEYEPSITLPRRSILYYGIRSGPKSGLLGSGGFGKVYKYTKTLPSGQQESFAVKVFNRSDVIDSLREIAILMRCDHPKILHLHDVTVVNGNPAIVLEYVEGVTLEKYIGNSSLSVKEILSVITQLVQGISYIHSKDIIHKDLKGDNVMVTKNLEVKIIDFGFSRANFCSPEERYHTGAGSPLYMAPEDLVGFAGYDKAKDIWSLGIIIYRLITGRDHVEGIKNVEELVVRLIEVFGPITKSDLSVVPEYGEFYNIHSYDDRGYREFRDSVKAPFMEIGNAIYDIFVLNPKKRPSADQLMSRLPVIKELTLERFPAVPCERSLIMRESYPIANDLISTLNDEDTTKVYINMDKIKYYYTILSLKTINHNRHVKTFQLTCWIVDSMLMRSLELNKDPSKYSTIFPCSYYIASLIMNEKNLVFTPMEPTDGTLASNNDNIRNILDLVEYDIIQTTSINYSSSSSTLFRLLSCMVYITDLKYKYLARDLNALVEGFYYKFISTDKIILNEDETLLTASVYSIIKTLAHIHIGFDITARFKELYFLF